MKKLILSVFLTLMFSLGLILLLQVGQIAAAKDTLTPSAFPLTQVAETSSLDPTATMEASQSADNASASATTVNPLAKQAILEKKDQDLTESTGGKTDALAAHLLEHDPQNLSWYNFVRVSLRQAINNGLPSNLVVLLILFPMVAMIIAFSRHVLGLRGFGIYTPAVLSIALLSTGIPLGIAMFVIIVLVSVVAQRLLKKINLAHLPKTALILWGVCVSVIAFLIAMALLDVKTFFSLSIFPLLILISLSENFTSTQLMSTTREAVRLTAETIITAVICCLIIGSNPIQVFVIVNPEISMLVIFGLCLLVGRYNGLRLSELLRFRALVKKK